MTRSVTRFRSILRFALAAAIPTAFAFAPRDAFAQGWLKDRGYQEGEGIKTGDVELHPGIGGEIGYDTNWFVRTHRDNFVNGAPTAAPTDAAILRITPSFTISTIGQNRMASDPVSARERPAFQFRGTLSATYFELFGKQEIRDQRNVALDATLRADINAGRPIGFGIFGGYRRIIQPNALADTSRSFNRNDIRGGGEVIFLPGGGTLDLRAGYQASASLFEESNGTPFNFVTHELSFKDRWRFRPRTALFSDATLRFVTYPNAQRASNFLNDAMPFRMRFGLTGLVTDRLSALLAIGYGSTFFQNPAAASSPQYNSILGNAELTYSFAGNENAAGEPGETSLLLSTISLGYARDFAQSFLGNFYESDKIYTRFRYLFGGRAILDLTADAERLGYPEVFVRAAPGAAPTLAATAFDNWLVGGSIFAEYRLSSRFGINTSIDYHEMVSDTAVPAGAVGPPGAGAGPGLFHLSWRRLQAFIGARYFF